MERAPDPLVGTVVAGRYELLEVRGEGALGRLYRAAEVGRGRAVALTVLDAKYPARAGAFARFQEASLALARLKHPNVAEVLEVGQLETGAYFLATELLEAGDLGEELGRAGTFEPLRGLRLALQLCRALAAAHAAGVVHGGLNPEAVSLQRAGGSDELTKIRDFAVAQLHTNEEAEARASRRRLTRSGAIFGTAEYFSPEQAGGRNLDRRADIYALGVIAYEMFTGAVPFADETFAGVLAKHLGAAPPAPSGMLPALAISGELERAILRALEKDPNERYADMTEFAKALQATPEGMKLLSQAFLLAPAAQAAVPAPRDPVPPPRETPPRETPPRETPPRETPPPHSAEPEPERERARSSLPAASRTTSGKAATASERPARRRWVRAKPAARWKSWLGTAVGASIAVAFAGAGSLLLRGRGGETVTPQSDARPARPLSTQSASAGGGGPAASTSAVTLKLSVNTAPPGASLSKSGVRVCDETPCDVLVGRNERVELVAQKGNLSGKMTVSTEREQSVTIQLVAASPNE